MGCWLGEWHIFYRFYAGAKIRENMERYGKKIRLRNNHLIIQCAREGQLNTQEGRFHSTLALYALCKWFVAKLESGR